MVLRGMQWHNRHMKFHEIRSSCSKVEMVWATAPAEHFAHWCTLPIPKVKNIFNDQYWAK
jgi:hypothetical protein